MADYLVIEIQIWLFLLIILALVSGGAVGAYYLWRHLRDRERRIAREAAEEAAAEHMVRRNRMLIRLDHELKNPLTAVRTSGATLRELVRDPTVSPQEIAASLDAMDAASRRVARLLADLRRLADVETRSIEFAPVDMETLVNQAVEDARTAPGAEGRTIVATVARAPWRLPPVAGEEDLLLSAVLNLLSNAVKYSGPEDVVEVRANEQVLGDHRWVVVEVADTGAGIPQSEQRAVFDELSRGTGVRSVAGSGMGLALVRTIVERHGGAVELHSQENVGTAVRIVLPALAGHPAGQQGPAAPGPGPMPGPGQASAAGLQLGTPVPPAAQQRPPSAPVYAVSGSGPAHTPPQGQPQHSWQAPTQPRQRMSGEASQPTQPHPMSQAGLAGDGAQPPVGPPQTGGQDAGSGERMLGSPRRTSRRRFAQPGEAESGGSPAGEAPSAEAPSAETRAAETRSGEPDRATGGGPAAGDEAGRRGAADA